MGRLQWLLAAGSAVCELLNASQFWNPLSVCVASCMHALEGRLDVPVFLSGQVQETDFPCQTVSDKDDPELSPVAIQLGLTATHGACFTSVERIPHMHSISGSETCCLMNASLLGLHSLYIPPVQIKPISDERIQLTELYCIQTNPLSMLHF